MVSVTLSESALTVKGLLLANLSECLRERDEPPRLVPAQTLPGKPAKVRAPCAPRQRTRRAGHVGIEISQGNTKQMATKASVAKNDRRKQIVERYKERRDELRALAKDERLPPDQRFEAQRLLNKLPRDSSPVRIRNRCAVSGRPRGYYRKFGLSRIALRDLALRGELPGVIKASW